MKKLIFIYNANSGKWNTYMDMAHKIFSPSTYPCSLCDLTYGIFKIRPEWEAFVQHSTVPLVFLHKDEFLQTYNNYSTIPLPAILSERTDGELAVCIDAATLTKLESIEALKKLILDKLDDC
jgi:hypothetical protein